MIGRTISMKVLRKHKRQYKHATFLAPTENLIFMKGMFESNGPGQEEGRSGDKAKRKRWELKKRKISVLAGAIFLV